MTITKTLLDLDLTPVKPSLFGLIPLFSAPKPSYLATQRVPGFPSRVTAISPTRIGAIASCSLKAEARVATYNRKNPVTPPQPTVREAFLPVRRLKVTCKC